LARFPAARFRRVAFLFAPLEALIVSRALSNSRWYSIIYNSKDIDRSCFVKRGFCLSVLAVFVHCFAGHACVAAQAHAQAPASPVAPAHARTLEGSWAGTLQAGDTVLHLILHVAKGDRDSLKGTLDSPDQGVYGIEAAFLVRTGSTLKMEVPSVNAIYEGKISVDYHTIQGTWSQGGASLPLLFQRQAHAASAKPPPDAVATSEGIWQGVHHSNGMALRLQLHISHDARGQLTARLDSIDQGINAFPAANVSQKEAAIHFDLSAVQGVYDGTLNAAQNLISGSLQQSGSSTVLNFRRSDQIPELRRPQTPVKPYPYKEVELTFANAKAGASLSGTLTLPRGSTPFPAAILLAGSGPLDRDAADSGHRPFLVLADYLTRKGIAVLRYDKRGVGKSSGDYDRATTADFASDAEAALAFLKSRKDIDARKIGIIGHSEGGVIAPMIASRSSDVAWIVLLAGPATKGAETLILQSDLIARAAGMTDEQVAKSLDFDRQAYMLVRQEKDRAVLEHKLGDLIKVSGLGPAMPPAMLQRQIHWTSSPWFHYFLDYDPELALQKTKCPVLALSGEKDLQVPPKENLPLLRKALEDGGNKDSQVVEFPGLNHLFQHCYMGLPAESRAIEETFAPEALSAISGWVLKRITP
jgi:pimeloyl-ACP methyl ester carboxylesterase